MKRIKVVGLCLGALFVLFAMSVANASAALPEYKVCGKDTDSGKKETGKFSDKLCSVAEPKGEGQYERLPEGSAKKFAFTGSNEGTPKNYIVNPFGKNKIKGEPGQKEGVTECTKEDVDAGAVTGPKTTTWETEYSSCEGNKSPANSKGKKAGVIVTDKLEATLVYLNKAKTEPGIQVKGLGPSGRLAQYEIPGLKTNVEVFGEVLVKQTENVNIANKKPKVTAAEGLNALQKNLYVEESNTSEEGKEYFEEYEIFLLCESGGAPFPPGKHTHAECEGFGLKYLEPAPVSLISIVTGPIPGNAPATQNGVSNTKGEAFLIEA